ncbi:hypothetical protein CYMTET_51343, partial [Cymbomonas tetramitiformis]
MLRKILQCTQRRKQGERVGEQVVTLAAFLDEDDECDELEEASGMTGQDSCEKQEIDQSFEVAGKDVNPLDWWRVHQFELPDLAKMARSRSVMTVLSGGLLNGLWLCCTSPPFCPTDSALEQLRQLVQLVAGPLG